MPRREARQLLAEAEFPGELEECSEEIESSDIPLAELPVDFNDARKLFCLLPPPLHPKRLAMLLLFCRFEAKEARRLTSPVGYVVETLKSFLSGAECVDF